MHAEDLSKFFAPDSIAIIGASTNIQTINGKPLHYLTKHGYAGKIYPVNPKYREIDGRRCYPSIQDIPDEIDLALIAVNYKLVPAMLKQCVAKGARFATIFSSGFAEAGQAGRAIQQQITDISQESGLRICGPNCQGAVDLHHTASAAFSASLDPAPFLAGPVGFVTQSGALGFSIFNLAQENGVGFSFVVSTGNEVDLDCVDYMNFMIADERTKMVFAYIEGFRHGAKFRQLADRALAAQKPLAILKVGRSAAGSKAASSHTAALTGSDQVIDALFKQKGIIRIADIEEFCGLAKLIDRTPVMPNGKGLGVVSISGGGGVICADAAEACGLEMVTLQPQTTATIAANIPPFGSPYNPVDITAQAINTADGFLNVIQAMLADPGVDALVVVITMIVGQPGLRMANDLVDISAATDKPIAVAWTAGANLMKAQFQVLHDAAMPLYQSPVRAVQDLAKLMAYGRAFHRRQAQMKSAAGKENIPATVPAAATALLQDAADKTMTERQSKLLLQTFGIPISREILAATLADAVAAAGQIGYPVAMKIDSPDIPHKTEARAIRLNVQDETELRDAFSAILDNAGAYAPKARINGVLIQEMVPRGVEVIVGMQRDPQFGPVIMFGLGGIFVEILKDVSLRVAPIDRREALAMITDIRGYGVLAGARGGRKADIDALADTLVKVADMARALGPALQELDINPLIVLPAGQGVKVADALAILQPS